MCYTCENYAHCDKAKDGKHVPDPSSGSVPTGLDPDEIIVDFNCKLCGISGGVRIAPDDVQWN